MLIYKIKTSRVLVFLYERSLNVEMGKHANL